MRPSGFLLERARPDDILALAALEWQCFSHPWSARNFRDAVADPGGLVLVLRSPFASGDEGRGILAYCVFQTVADEMHIHNLAVHPRHRGRGLGRWLLSFALDLGGRRGARTALLEVRPSNHTALDLYLSLRFRTVSVRRRYYTRPSEDALLLERTDLPGQAPGPGAKVP